MKLYIREFLLNIRCFNLATFLLATLAFFLCCKLYCDKKKDDENSMTLPKRRLIVTISIIVLGIIFIWFSPAWLNNLILSGMNVYICVFVVVLPIFNINRFSDDFRIIQMAYYVFIDLICIPTNANIDFSNSINQIGLLLYIQNYSFLFLDLIFTSIAYILNAVSKKKKKQYSVKNAALLMSKIALIVSVVIVYSLIVHDNFSQKIIMPYEFIAEALVIPILLSLMQYGKT